MPANEIILEITVHPALEEMCGTEYQEIHQQLNGANLSELQKILNKLDQLLLA